MESALTTSPPAPGQARASPDFPPAVGRRRRRPCRASPAPPVQATPCPAAAGTSPQHTRAGPPRRPPRGDQVAHPVRRGRWPRRCPPARLWPRGRAPASTCQAARPAAPSSAARRVQRRAARRRPRRPVPRRRRRCTPRRAGRRSRGAFGPLAGRAVAQHQQGPRPVHPESGPEGGTLVDRLVGPDAHHPPGPRRRGATRSTSQAPTSRLSGSRSALAPTPAAATICCRRA